MAAPIRSDFCTFDREFGTILEIGHLQPEFDLDGRLGRGRQVTIRITLINVIVSELYILT